MSTDGYARHTPELAGVKIIRALSIDSALIPHVSDAITKLTNDYVWLEKGDSVSDIVTECLDAIYSWYDFMNIGQVSSFLGALPAGWLALDGSTYDEDDYPELWGALDAQFKDEPSSTFTLPDMGGLVNVAAGNGFLVGDDGGVADVALSIAELPAHTHNYLSTIFDIDIKTVGVPDPGGARVGPPAATTATGSGSSHDNMMPYFTVVMGIFSGRA